MNIRLPFGDIRVGWQPPLLRTSHAFTPRLPALLLLALTLVGCASSEHLGGPGYADRPPTNRTALVAWQETQDARVRSAEDLIAALQVPLLAVLGSEGRKGRRAGLLPRPPGGPLRALPGPG